MTWLTWRQHRTEVLTLGLVLVAFGIALVALGLPMHSLLPSDATRCATDDTGAANACQEAWRRLAEDFGYTDKMLTLFNVMPFAIGAFLGAPLLARELETGTWQLAWTQAVPRMRWLAVKLVALTVVTAVLAAAFAALIMWYRKPLDVFDDRFEGGDSFDLEGVAPVAYALFAFAVAAAAGTVLRRSLPALAAAFAAFVAVRGVATWLRPTYGAPRTLTKQVTADNTNLTDEYFHSLWTGDHRNWIIDAGYQNAAGRKLTDIEFYDMVAAAREAKVGLSAYLEGHGLRQFVTYHPADSFWTFQLIEAAIFVSLAAALLALVAWRVKRRVF